MSIKPECKVYMDGSVVDNGACFYETNPNIFSFSKLKILKRIEDADKWRWYCEDDNLDGVKYAGVTGVLSCAVDQKLQSYFKNNSANKQTKRLTETGDIGTAIHELVERDLKGETSVVIDSLKGPFDKWLETKQKHSIKVILPPEMMVYSKTYGWAGTCDYPLIEIDGKRYVGDLKTGWFKVQAGWQIAAYRAALIEMGIIDSSVGMAGIQIKRDGSGATVFKFEHLDWCLKSWVSCFETWKALYFTKLAKIEWPYLHVNSLNLLQETK